MKKTLRLAGLCGALALGLMTCTAGTAQAQGTPVFGGLGNYGYQGTPVFGGLGTSGYQGTPVFGGMGNYGSGYQYGPAYGGFGSGPVYDPPSVHYDRVYHPTASHWTPFRGWHTHGHVDMVPHYVPGHLDYQNGPFIQPNPYYHGR